MSLLAAALATVAFSQTTATRNMDGSVRITREGTLIATIAPMIALQGWSFVGFTTAGDGTIRANVPGGKIAGVVVASHEPSFLSTKNLCRVTFEAKPDVDVSIETSCLSLTFGPEWAGANYRGGTLPIHFGGSGGLISGYIPQTFLGQALYAGLFGHLDIQKGTKRISAFALKTQNALLQDSRGFGGGFDLRIGIPKGSEIWPKDQVRRYAVLISTEEPLTVQDSKTLTIQQNADWIPLEAHLDVAKGSVLDWTPKNVDPAGSKGWVQAKNGHFVFEKEPAKPVRFYGPNLVFSAAFPEKELATKLAERLQRMGFNTARFHHFDGELTGGWDNQSPKSTELVPAVLDKIEFLVSELKKRGIYTTIDLYTIRKIRKDEIMPGDMGMDEYKALLLVSEKARENWWEFARNLLTHKNPYTGLAWKDDPAIPWICVVNENSVGSAVRSAKPEVKKLFTDAWQKAGNTGEWSYETDEGARFGAKLQMEAYEWMKAKLRSIGVKALLTDVNGWHEQTAQVPVRENLDYVDNHDYWDHPSFLGSNWGLPSRGWSGGGMATKALGGGLINKALSRVKGLPFTVSEFNFVAPNRYRSEGGLLIGAMAARQDWDVMWRFAWSHSQENLREPKPFDYFNVQSDPAMIASERAIVSLFLKGDMPIAKQEKVVRLLPAAKNYSAPVSRQIMDVRLYGSSKDGDPTGVEVPLTREAKPVSVDTEKGVLRIETPNTSGVFAPTGESFVAGPLTVKLDGHRAALWASSVDGKPLTTSGRILLSHITDVQNSGIRYAAEDRDVLQDWGRLPWLVRNGSAQVSLKIDHPEKVTVWRLDMAGNRVGKIAAKTANGSLAFEATVKGPNGAAMYYELVR